MNMRPIQDILSTFNSANLEDRIRYNLDSVTFENTSGWTVQLEGQTTDGTPVDVSDPEENEEYFASTYNEYIWVRFA